MNEEDVAADAPTGPTDADLDARHRRATRLRAAVVTGGLAKVLAVVVQLVAVGIAVRVLDVEAFGAYLVLASLVAWLGLAAVGVGPGLTQRIAITSASGDTAGQATAFTSSVTLAGLFVLGAILVLLGVVGMISTEGTSQSAVTTDVRTAGLILGIMTAVQVWLSVIEASQLGHQEQAFANTFQAIGLLSVLVVLLVAGQALVTVTAFVAATAGPPLLTKAANAGLYLTRRRHLLTRSLSIRTAVGVLSTSVGFAFVQLGATASQQLGFLWLAFVAGPAATVPLGVMLRLTNAAAGLVGLVTQPLWPALADAVARQDTAWARDAYRRAAGVTFAYAVAYAVGLAVAGTAVVAVWTGSQVDVPQSMLLLFGVYFIAGVWAHVNAVTLVGLSRVWVAARVACLEALVSVVGAVLLVPLLGGAGVILALMVATLLVSATLLPIAVHRAWPAGLPKDPVLAIDDGAEVAL